MSEYRDKFIEAEEQASKLVSHLIELKNEAVNYKNAKSTIEKTQERISVLVEKFSSVIEGENNLVKTLREIGTDQIIEKIEKTKSSLEEKINAQNALITKLITFIYVIIGLNIILGLLILFLR